MCVFYGKEIRMKIKLSLPTAWDELTDAQMERIAPLLYSDRKGPGFDIAVLLILVNCRWFTFWRNYKVMRVLKDVPVSELKQYFAFIYKDRNRSRFPKTLFGGWATLINKLQGPAARLTNITAAEFAYTEGFKQLWDKERHRNPLAYMAAVLYKPKGHTFSKDDLDALSKKFEKVPLSKLMAMELAYNGSKHSIVKRFPQAFPKTAKQQTKQNKYGFGKVILSMAGGKFGTHDETGRTNIYTFLEEFQENLK